MSLTRNRPKEKATVCRGRENDKGRRLDHVWVTPALKPELKSASILRQARGWEKPSDHVPVIVDLEA